jgi:hypothetical protein
MLQAPQKLLEMITGVIEAITYLAIAAEILASSCSFSSALNPECTNNTRPSGLTNIEVGMVLMANFFADSP